MIINIKNLSFRNDSKLYKSKKIVFKNVYIDFEITTVLRQNNHPV